MYRSSTQCGDARRIGQAPSEKRAAQAGDGHIGAGAVTIRRGPHTLGE